MKTQEAISAAHDFAKGKGWDHEVPLLIGQLALIVQIEDLIQSLERGNKEASTMRAAHAAHLDRIEKLLSARPPIEQPRPEQPKPVVEQPPLKRSWIKTALGL
jgi:hypothetical protein